MKNSDYYPQESAKSLLNHISSMEEEADQSREEQCMPSFDDFEVLPSQDQQMPKKSIIGVRSLKAQKFALGQICRKEAESSWEPHKNEQHLKEIQDLKEMNRKLFEDNKALLQECVRLKLMLIRGDSGEAEDDRKMAVQTNRIQVDSLNQTREILLLKQQNDKLKRQVEELRRGKNFSGEDSTLKSLIKQNSMLTRKVEEFERKEFVAKCSGIGSTLMSSSGNSEIDPNRVINGIKIGYEKQIRVLQDEIKGQTEQISLLNRAVSRSVRTHQSPRVARPAPL